MQNYQKMMLPIMVALSQNETMKKQEIREFIIQYMNVSKADSEKRMPGGAHTILFNRLGWAITYLKKAGLIETVKWGVFSITESGLELMKNPPKEITTTYLEQYDGFYDFFVKPKLEKKAETERLKALEQAAEASSESIVEADELVEEDDPKTPEEVIEESVEALNKELVDNLLTTIKSCTPSFLEKLVVDLLVKMGYGGSRADAGRAIGKSHDEGIDGIINEDRLGLDVVYIQAKRWQNTVCRPDIQAFAGSLEGQRAKKGIFITTSTYSKGAREYVGIIEKKIVLIDGQRLAELMIEFDVGVNEENRYVIKKMDMDYFEAV